LPSASVRLVSGEPREHLAVTVAPVKAAPVAATPDKVTALPLPPPLHPAMSKLVKANDAKKLNRTLKQLKDIQPPKKNRTKVQTFFKISYLYFNIVTILLLIINKKYFRSY
jgi:hypothetical protein